MKTIMTHPLIWLCLIFALGVGIRSLHFPLYLNFSTDQASSAREALRIWNEKSIELIGPSISFSLNGRQIFTGSITYYFMLPFLLLGNKDPVTSSYLYMVFSMLMVVPFYVGVKKLSTDNHALLASAIYAFLPFYIDYSRFFWNPNFQFTLTPLLIVLLGFYHEKKTSLTAFLTGLGAGTLLLFHYQYILILLGLCLYFVLQTKKKHPAVVLFIIGVISGFSPMILFEVRNQFYNTQTLLFLIQNNYFAQAGNSRFAPHYFLSISLFLLAAGIARWQTLINTKVTATTIIGLFLFSTFTYAQSPSHGFGMTENWNILSEKKANDLILKQNLTNYNIVNQGYDTVATVQKYLLSSRETPLKTDDYYNNRYLFVITNRIYYMEDGAYEIAAFSPSTELAHWPINQKYTLYLRKRL